MSEASVNDKQASPLSLLKTTRTNAVKIRLNRVVGRGSNQCWRHIRDRVEINP